MKFWCSITAASSNAARSVALAEGSGLFARLVAEGGFTVPKTTGDADELTNRNPGLMPGFSRQ